jgi:hypothetical protein
VGAGLAQAGRSARRRRRGAGRLPPRLGAPPARQPASWRTPAVVAAATAGIGAPQDLLDGYRAGLAALVAAAAPALAITLLGLRRGDPAAAT